MNHLYKNTHSLILSSCDQNCNLSKTQVFLKMRSYGLKRVGIVFILIFFPLTAIFSFFSRHKYLHRSEGMTFNVRNMEIDLNSNIPQLTSGALFFQGGTVRQYISTAKCMIILKPL